jgi:hypothetical protein
VDDPAPEHHWAVGDAMSLLLDTVASLEAVRATQDAGPGSGAASVVAGPELLIALTALRRLRDQLTRWEPALIAAARDRGVTWTDLAPALGVSSRQAAESRYLRLPRDPSDPSEPSDPSTTREQRMRASRDRRSGDRAVAGWARDNAAALRALAGQITARPASPDEDGTESTAAVDLDDGGTQLVARVNDALGSDDAADLVDPLLKARATLEAAHPELADQIATLAATAQQIRTADLSRRNPTTPPLTANPQPPGAGD